MADATYPHVFRFRGDSADTDYHSCTGPILDWCRKEFGIPKRHMKRHGFGNERWIHEVFALYFKHDDDAFTVRMRWC
jgi:hypothetical protein